MTGHRTEIIKLARQLIRVPSVDDSETRVCRLIEKHLNQYGLKGRYFGKDKKRLNFIARLKGKKKGKTLLFNGHTDVVPPGDESKWRYRPFSGKLIGGRIYGRGAADMKGGLASLVLAAILVQESGARFNGEVVFSFTANEENPRKDGFGVPYLLKKGLLKADVCLIAEPRNEFVVIGCRGLYRFSLKTIGKAWHTGRLSARGINAVLKMAKVLLALDKLSLDYQSHQYFPPPKISPGTVISGGSAINIVPEECQALVDIRLSYGQTEAGVKKELQALWRKLMAQDKDLKIKTKKIICVPPAVIDEKEPIVSLLQKNARPVLGFTPGLKVAGSMSDANFFISQGIPTVMFGPMGEGVHSENEYVVVNSIFKVAEIFSQTAFDFLGRTKRTCENKV